MPSCCLLSTTNSTVSVPYMKLATMLKPASTTTVDELKNALMPTPICCSGPSVPPSVASPGRLRALILLTISAEKPKVAALIPNTSGVGPMSSSPAPIAGPTMMVRFSIAACTLLAAARCSSPTMAGIVARAVGS